MTFWEESLITRQIQLLLSKNRDCEASGPDQESRQFVLKLTGGTVCTMMMTSIIKTSEFKNTSLIKENANYKKSGFVIAFVSCKFNL